MAVVEMAGLTVVGPEKEVTEVAKQLLARGCFEPLSIDSVVGSREIRSRLSTGEGNPWDRLLKKMESIWKSADRPLPEPVMSREREALSLEDVREKVDSLAGRIEIWEKRARELEMEKERLEVAGICAEALENSRIDMSDAFNTDIVRIFAGSLSYDNYEKLVDASQEVPLLPVLLKKSGDLCWILVITVSGYLEGAEKLLGSVFFRDYDLQDLLQREGRDLKERLGKRLEKISTAVKKLREATGSYISKNREDLEVLYARIYCMKKVYDICRKRGELSGLYLVSGWLPAKDLEDMERMVDKLAPATVILSEAVPRSSEGYMKIPVFLKNLPFVRFFQDLVALYSLPGYNESDPSIFVAFTFCLFFGFMFGDVAHGLILSVAAMVMQKRGILSRSFGAILGIAGLSSVAFGFLYGSVFGNEHIIRGLWLSPLEDIDRLISSSILLGIAVISAGMIINIYIRSRKKEWGKVLFDVQGIAGLLLYWLSVVLAWSFLSSKDLPFSPWFITLPCLMLVLVIFFSESLAVLAFRVHKSGESPVVHVFHVLHNLLAFLSNTVSFVRLAAFALNHVGLSLAVLMLSQMTSGLPGGSFLSLVILLAGHLVIVSLEGLIVFIQTLRLEYYEFFSKFYAGGGRPFSPIRWK